MADNEKKMTLNVEKMIEDGVEEKLIFLAQMNSASQFEKIAMNLENPQIFSQFLNLDEDAIVWDYAYAAGLINRADADLIKSYYEEDEDDEEPGGQE